MSELVVQFMAEASAWNEAGPATSDEGETVPGTHGAERGATPRLAIAAEASLGKTEAVLKALRSEVWRGRRVLYLVPSLSLADELAERARAATVDGTDDDLSPYYLDAVASDRDPVDLDDLAGQARALGVGNVHVVRGRSQENPDRPGESMCLKDELARIVAALGHGVTETLCKSKTGETCEHYEGCAYVKQLAALKKGGGLLIGAHQYLPLTMDLLKEDRIDLVVIDESFWQAMLRHSSISIERFCTPRLPNPASSKYKPRKGEKLVDKDVLFLEDADDFERIHAKAVDAIRRAEQAGRQVTLADFRDAALSEADCRFAASIEYGHLGSLQGIHPGMTFEAQKAALKSAKAREAFACARFWKLVEAELASGREGELQSLRLVVGHVNHRTKTLENAVVMDWSADARFQRTPVLCIDANAEAEIVGRFYEGMRVERIVSKWSNVRVTQVVDRTGSKYSYTNEANRERARTLAHDVAIQLSDRTAEAWRRIAADPKADRRQDPRPLLVVHKGVEDAWKEAGHGYAFDGGPAAPGAPFHVAHFGALRGKDTWKKTVAIIVAGRVEPSPYDIERMSRALFYRSRKAIVLIEEDERKRIVLPRRPVEIKARDGSRETVQVSYHPDHRADLVLRQVREADLSQTIARVRPVHRDDASPCEVLVLTSVPLEIEPDRFIRWNEVVPDRWRLMEIAGFVPDVAADVAAAYPRLFATEAAVWQAAKRRADSMPDESYKMIFYGGCQAFENSVRVTYRRTGNRRRRGGAVAALAGDTPETVAARVLAALPDAFDVEVLGALPDPLEAATAALDAATDLDELVDALEEAGERVWWRIRPETGRLSTRRNAVRPLRHWTDPPDPGGGPR